MSTLDALFTGSAVKGVGGSSGGGGSSITVEPLDVTKNGTYTAPENTAYNPVMVNVQSTPGAVTEDDDVLFIDYDGTMLYSYTAAEFAEIDAMPDNPQHEGLVAQGWNWSLAEAKNYVASYRQLVIGQMYTTSDGATRFYVDIDSEMMPVTASLTFRTENDAVTVDWGDGSTPDVSVIGVNVLTHEYINRGKYTISITPNSNACAIRIGVSRADSPALTIKNGVYSTGEIPHSYLYAVEIGNNVVEFYGGIFRECYNLRTITLSNSLQRISTGSNFYNDAQLKCIVLPNSMLGSIYNLAYQGCRKMRFISLPASITNIDSSAFGGNNDINGMTSLVRLHIPGAVESAGLPDHASNLKYVTLPNTCSSISHPARCCTNLRKINIPTNLSSIIASFLQGCHNVVINNLIIPSTVTFISNNAFSQSGITGHLTMSDNVTSIGANILSECAGVREITISAGVTTLTSNVFRYSNLKIVHFRSSTPPTVTSSATLGSGLNTDAVIYVPYSEDHTILNAYKTANYWSEVADKIFEEPQS